VSAANTMRLDNEAASLAIATNGIARLVARTV
jgi:hypothetical protein